MKTIKNFMHEFLYIILMAVGLFLFSTKHDTTTSLAAIFIVMGLALQLPSMLVMICKKILEESEKE